MGNRSVLQLRWTSTGWTNGQRAEKRGLREILSMYINIWWGRKKEKQSQIFTVVATKLRRGNEHELKNLENLLTYKRKKPTKLKIPNIFHCHGTQAVQQVVQKFCNLHPSTHSNLTGECLEQPSLTAPAWSRLFPEVFPTSTILWSMWKINWLQQRDL